MTASNCVEAGLGCDGEREIDFSKFQETDRKCDRIESWPGGCNWIQNAAGRSDKTRLSSGLWPWASALQKKRSHTQQMGSAKQHFFWNRTLAAFKAGLAPSSHFSSLNLHFHLHPPPLPHLPSTVHHPIPSFGYQTLLLPCTVMPLSFSTVDDLDFRDQLSTP